MKTNHIVAYPDAEFAVISDLHYYDNSLGTTGTAFENVLKSDRKLLKYSSDLLDFAVDNILKCNVTFVLVPGDLTKDGELICHQKAATALSRLTRHGIKVYVIPGNHDVNNPLSYKYQGDKSIKVPNVTPNIFADTHKDCGYNSTIYRDPNTLSYVAEPIHNLWVVALDTCRYKENKPCHKEIVGGKLSRDEEKWLCEILKKANLNKKAVVILAHHGVLEHWKGQSKFDPDYLIDDYKRIGKLMASYDVRLAFTGHYHAQDITLKNFNNNGFIYDIETGSLVTPPCPVRYCRIADNKITIKSEFLVHKIYLNTNFAKYAGQFVFNSVKRDAYKILRKFFVSEADANKIADYVAVSFVEHYNGDEDISKRPTFDRCQLNFWSKIIFSIEKYIFDGLWRDLPPRDNYITLDLSKI